MSGLALKDVTKQFGSFTAVNNVELTVPHGTFVCMLGPSGCGKTTLLRMIAGLDLPTGGAIVLDSQDITPIPTHKRNLGMVFQSLALFPHLTVGDNIAYPLRIRGAPKEEQKKRVDELLASSICRAMRTGRSLNSPAASASASRSPGRSRSRRSSSCSTSRFRRSTPSCARRCRWNFASCSRNSASPRSS